MKMNSNTPDQKEALDTIRAAINGSRTGDAVQACLCVAAMKAVDQIEAALQAAQVEKVEGLAEYKIRIEAAKQRLGDAKAIHSEWMMMPNYEAEKYAQNKMPEIEHIIYSAICYLDGIEGRNREAARLQLARQEGK